MEQIEIKSFSDKLFVAFKDLYSISFPIFEQRTEAQQMKAFACPDYHLLCFVENIYDHVHSPYREGCRAHHLEVLSFPSGLASEEYASFCCQLTQVVMTKYL